MEKENKDKQDAIILFSGGKDSFLATCQLIENSSKVYMVTFDNFAGIAGNNAEHGARRIIERYGNACAEFLGVYSTAGIWRELILPFLNMKPSEILAEYGEITTSQFNCLTCRSAMYVWTIIKAKEMGIYKIADGAREDQGFVIELPCMTEKFKSLFLGFGLELSFPVINLKSDWQEKNLLLARGFVPKVIEPQCLVGAPLPNRKEPDLDIQNAVVKYFEKVIIPRAKGIVNGGFPITSKGDFI